jgi:hypothetical protein
MRDDTRCLLIYTGQLAVFYCRIVARGHTLCYENSVGQVDRHCGRLRTDTNIRLAEQHCSCPGRLTGVEWSLPRYGMVRHNVAPLFRPVHTWTHCCGTLLRSWIRTAARQPRYIVAMNRGWRWAVQIHVPRVPPKWDSVTLLRNNWYSVEVFVGRNISLPCALPL